MPDNINRKTRHLGDSLLSRNDHLTTLEQSPNSKMPKDLNTSMMPLTKSCKEIRKIPMVSGKAHPLDAMKL